MVETWPPNEDTGRPPKRLIVACDGTWMNNDSAWEGPSWIPASLRSLVYTPKSDLQKPPSNVTRICRAISHESADGVPQIVYYHAGVGTGDTLTSRMMGGAMGQGIVEHIREAYAFIAQNWTPGTEIVLLGFSRGAFTVRSVSGFIASVGILNRNGMNEFLPIFRDWENQLDEDYQRLWPESWPEGLSRPSFRDSTYAMELHKRGLTRLNVPVKALGVWDTVGSLGIPNIFGVTFSRELAFIDTQVARNVEYAFQALALDESRAPYLPTVWELPRSRDGGQRNEGSSDSEDDSDQEEPTLCSHLKVLKQVWFPGVHSNVGGSYPDAELANVSLAWMMAQFNKHGILRFVDGYLTELHSMEVSALEHYRGRKHSGFEEAGKVSNGVSLVNGTKDSQRTIDPCHSWSSWAMGRIYNSMTPLFRVGGACERTPGRNTQINPHTGAFIHGRRLKGSNERIHSSVRIRRLMKGSGLDGKGVWRPAAMEDWQLQDGETGSPVALDGTAALDAVEEEDEVSIVHTSKRKRARLAEGGHRKKRKGIKKATQGARDPERGKFKWVSDVPDDRVELWEDKLEDLELELLKCSPGIYWRFKHSL